MGHNIISDIKNKKETVLFQNQISNLKYVKKDAAGKVRASKFIGGGVAPKGGIIMWSGSPAQCQAIGDYVMAERIMGMKRQI